MKEWHKEIVRRMAAIRRFNGWTQAHAAECLGTNRAYLAAIESGRIELPACIGWRACHAFDIHWKWLLLASPPQGPFPALPPEVGAWLDDHFAVQEGTPFATAMASVSWLIEGEAAAEQFRIAIVEGRASNPAKFASPAPPLNQPPPTPTAPAPKDIPEKALTNDPPAVTSSPVQPIMPTLVERVRKATEARGRKTELAAVLGVPRQRMNDWLSGQREPDGETTLRLLHWVEPEERKPKQKSPASVTTPAEPKAQVIKPNEKENNSGPPPG